MCQNGVRDALRELSTAIAQTVEAIEMQSTGGPDLTTAAKTEPAKLTVIQGGEGERELAGSKNLAGETAREDEATKRTDGAKTMETAS
jgi:hypothetical protein